MHRPSWETQGLEARTQENLISLGVVLALLKVLVMWPVHFDDEPTT
jgi:hypothetical protein